MTLREIVVALSLKVCSAQGELDREVTGGYTSDLLSCVMARARRGNIWVTLQAHPNIVAVAVLLELAGIVITEGVEPEPATLARAEAERIPILCSNHTSYQVVSQLTKLGIEGSE